MGTHGEFATESGGTVKFAAAEDEGLADDLILVAEVVKPSRSLHALFWLESVAVVSFGVSWLVKGEFLGLLADPS